MNNRFLLSFVAALLASVGTASAEARSDCSNSKSVPITEVNDTLSQRSVAILDIARQGEVASLSLLMSPTARFTVWDGDAGFGRKFGAAGMVEFAQRIGATGYRYMTTFAGPISSDICGKQEVTIWLTRPDGQRSYVAVFKYVKGILVGATATMGQLSEGKLTDEQ